MNPEEKALLERVAALSESNNKLLKIMERRGKWLAIWSVIKIALFILPFIAGYILLQPYLGQAANSLGQYKDLLNQI